MAPNTIYVNDFQKLIARYIYYIYYKYLTTKGSNQHWIMHGRQPQLHCSLWGRFFKNKSLAISAGGQQLSFQRYKVPWNLEMQYTGVQFCICIHFSVDLRFHKICCFVMRCGVYSQNLNFAVQSCNLFNDCTCYCSSSTCKMYQEGSLRAEIVQFVKLANRNAELYRLPV